MLINIYNYYYNNNIIIIIITRTKMTEIYTTVKLHNSYSIITIMIIISSLK